MRGQYNWCIDSVLQLCASELRSSLCIMRQLSRWYILDSGIFKGYKLGTP